MTPSPGEVPGAPRAAESARSELRAALLDALDCAVVACDASGAVLYANSTSLFLWAPSGDPAGAHAAVRFPFSAESGTVLAGDAHPLHRAMAGERVTDERLHLLGEGGRRVPVDVSAQPLPPASAFAGGAMMSVREQREPASVARLRTYVSDFEILTEVSRLLADVQDAEEAASIICTVAIGSTGATAVLLWEMQDGVLMLRWQEGMVGGESLDRLTAEARSGAERAMAERHTRVENPLADASPAAGSVTAGTAWHEPLMTSGRATGALSIVWPGVLTDLERPGWLIEALAHHAATALERADLVRRLNAAARTDPLTGLANRRVWNERVDHELARAEREQAPLSLVLIDIDRFKAYNDRFGHPEGDTLLAAAAAAWCKELRTTDLLARVGGEEFAVLLPGCPLENARMVAERLRLAMPQGETCSLGVTTWDGRASASQLYAIADSALYRAKEGGRNQVQLGIIPGSEPLELAS